MGHINIKISNNKKNLDQNRAIQRGRKKEKKREE